jgi:ATP-dependent RNA helicase RhlE
MTFKELNIIEPILKALDDEGYSRPTPIQELSIPILQEKKDLLGCAQTGTGKTAAFAIPILQHLSLEEKQTKGRRKIQALIITPTRELAIQIGESFSTYGKYTELKNTVIFGGVNQNPQTRVLNSGVDILVATPGRLLDLMDQGFISLSDVKYFVLDEADHMLDMGFIHDIKKIVARVPEKRQSLFFSATMPPSIVKLSGNILGKPEKVTIHPEQTTAEKVTQSLYYVSKKNKPKLLIHLLQSSAFDSVLIFSRTKHGANKIVRILEKVNIKSEAIHGNKSQSARQKALTNFKTGVSKVLIATDIAARGIDVEEMSHVINFDLPNIPETYIHRIGRTGRAGASGVALSFCDVEERPYLKDIEKLIGQKIPVISENPYFDDTEDVPGRGPAKPQQQNRRPSARSRSPRTSDGGNRTSNNRRPKPKTGGEDSRQNRRKQFNRKKRD